MLRLLILIKVIRFLVYKEINKLEYRFFSYKSLKNLIIRLIKGLVFFLFLFIILVRLISLVRLIRFKFNILISLSRLGLVFILILLFRLILKDLDNYYFSNYYFNKLN